MRWLGLVPLALLVGLGGAAAAETVPPDRVTITTPVTDLGGYLIDAERDQIDGALRRLRDRTGIQMAAVLVDSTGPLSIDAYARSVFDRWGGGSAERDDGVLFVLAVGDRANRLHLGDGLTVVITDADAKRILDGTRPELRAGAYGAATAKVIDGVASRVAHIRPGGPIVRRPPPWGESSILHGVAIAVLGVAAGVGWYLLRRRAAPPLPWYLRGWAALLGIAVGAIAIALLYFGGPSRAHPALWVAATLFGLSLCHVVRRDWRLALVLVVFAGGPLAPIAAVGAYTIAANGAPPSSAMPVVVAITTVLLGLAAMLGPASVAKGGSSGGRRSPRSRSTGSSRGSSSDGGGGGGGGGWSGGGGTSSGGGASSSW